MQIWRCDTDVRNIERRHAAADGRTVHGDVRVEESVNVSGARRGGELTSAAESQIAARYHPGTCVISKFRRPLRQVVGHDDNAGEYFESRVAKDGPDGSPGVPVVHHDSNNPACGSHFSVSDQVSA
jgi:hypothetical protein